MRIAHGFEAFDPPAAGTALSIGNFDGVHRGHQRIFEILRDVATPRGLQTLAITLEPHPLAVLNPERAPARLCTIDEKLELIRRCGADACLVLKSDAALLSLTAGEFLAKLIVACRPRFVVEGPDFNFGRNRAGSIATLAAEAERSGFTLQLLPTINCRELPSNPRISSSSIRQALVDGRLDDANVMLGRPYFVAGVVSGGDQRGRTIGFPTANIEQIPHLLPQEAVYAAIAELEDKSLHLAAVNVGRQPTFDGHRSRVEAHVLDFSGDLMGQRMGLHFLERLRSQTRFGGIDALIAQIRADVVAVRRHAGALARIVT